LVEQSQAARELADVTRQIKETLDRDALDSDGNLADTYHGTLLGRRYLDLKARATSSHSRDAIESTIFNHLNSFFSRYYQDGDFISKRRYSRRQRYAIPYNGEEVYLYWANNDQYYVKTAEYFTDYTFTGPNGVTVHFKLQDASVEQNNIKGENRFFVPSSTHSTGSDRLQQEEPAGRNHCQSSYRHPEAITSQDRRARPRCLEHRKAAESCWRAGHISRTSPSAVYEAEHVRLLHSQELEGIPLP
jgi:hypothetical protein